MPTATFYNLPDEKRERLTEAIKKELTRKSITEISINKIVQMAQISRGSFYQYFQDKEDMLGYIIDYYNRKIFEGLKIEIQKENGDIFKTMEGMLDYIVKFVTVKQGNAFFKNILKDLSVTMTCLDKCSKERIIVVLLKEIIPYIDCTILDIEEEEDFLLLLEIVFGIVRNAIVEVFMEIDNYNVVRERYLRKLKLIKCGVVKGK